MGLGCRDRRRQRLEGYAPSPELLRMAATLEATPRQEGLSLRAVLVLDFRHQTDLLSA